MMIIKVIFDLLKSVLTICTLLLAVWFLNVHFNFFGNYEPFLVQSGSMEPIIMIGDIVLVQDRPSYAINDIVTFRNETGRVITHRIVAMEQKQDGTYATKGDANQAGDSNSISEEQIVGKVVFTIPKLGFAISFAKSRWGLIILLIIPAIFFILDELLKLKRNANAVD
ncbi:MAG: signal peptidase I [Candidatus Moraniibacteriota bacterium]